MSDLKRIVLGGSTGNGNGNGSDSESEGGLSDSTSTSTSSSDDSISLSGSGSESLDSDSPPPSPSPSPSPSHVGDDSGSKGGSDERSTPSQESVTPQSHISAMIEEEPPRPPVTTTTPQETTASSLVPEGTTTIMPEPEPEVEAEVEAEAVDQDVSAPAEKNVAPPSSYDLGQLAAMIPLMEDMFVRVVERTTPTHNPSSPVAVPNTTPKTSYDVEVLAAIQRSLSGIDDKLGGISHILRQSSEARM